MSEIPKAYEPQSVEDKVDLLRSFRGQTLCL